MGRRGSRTSGLQVQSQTSVDRVETEIERRREVHSQSSIRDR